jgi:hypothetical protein
MIVFDIETGPLPEENLRELCPPWEPPPNPGTFDPSSVKIGNTKDADKIAAKITAARAAHDADVANYEKNCTEGEAGNYQAFVDEAALSPLTGRVLAIGFQPPSGQVQLRHIAACDGEEGDLLSIFWRLTERAIQAKESMVGHNILGFDLPFLLRRSWMLGVEPTSDIFDGRYWHRCFVDTMKRWQCGSYQERFVKLDVLAKAFGLKGKLDEDGVSGAEFARFYWGSPQERELALRYAHRDVEQTAAVAGKMGVI